MTEIQTSTPWGTATIGEEYVMVEAHGGEMYGWANRTDERWPCSVLARCDHVQAVFNVDGLVDLEVGPEPDEDDDLDIPVDELTAWTNDVLAAAGGLDEAHPAWFALIGQHLHRSRPGVEGPFRYPSGWEGYYDPREGRYLGLDDVYKPRSFTP